MSTGRRSLARPEGNRITPALIVDREGWRTRTNICGADCASVLAANFSCYNNQNVFCSQMMRNGIIGSQCYHKYNLRKACVGPVSFVPERVSYSGEAFSSIRRFQKKTLNFQQTAEVQVPSFALCDLIQIDSRLWAHFCVGKWFLSLGLSAITCMNSEWGWTSALTSSRENPNHYSSEILRDCMARISLVQPPRWFSQLSPTWDRLEPLHRRQGFSLSKYPQCRLWLLADKANCS